MGIFGIIFFSKEIAQLEAFKATLTDAEEIKKVEKAIEILKMKDGE